jgi:hypothetical protein
VWRLSKLCPCKDSRKTISERNLSMTGIRIKRSKHVQQFIVIGNAQARDTTISFRARGLHHHLLSLPPDWHVTSATLAEDNPEGRDAVRSALTELENARYITRVREQDARGRWSTVMEVHDVPQPEPVENPEPEPGKPMPGNPSPVPPGKTRVSAGHTEDGFPGIGFPGANKKTGTKERENKLSPRERAHEVLADALPLTERERDFVIDHVTANLRSPAALPAYITQLARNHDLGGYLPDATQDNLNFFPSAEAPRVCEHGRPIRSLTGDPVYCGPCSAGARGVFYGKDVARI